MEVEKQLAPPPITFAGLLAMIASADEGLTLDIDPAVLVGDLRSKVDDIHYVMERLKALGEWAGNQMEPFQKAKQAAERNHKRLKAYVAEHMIQNNFEKIPGDSWRVQLQENGPALEVTEQPNLTFYELFPQYVEKIIEYRWKTDRLKTDLESGALKEFPYAKLRRVRYARFWPNAPEKLTAKTKGKG